MTLDRTEVTESRLTSDVHFILEALSLTMRLVAAAYILRLREVMCTGISLVQ